MKLTRTATRSPDEVASVLGDLVEQGRTLLVEVLDKPARRAPSVRDTLHDVSEKLAEYQASATRATKHGARQGARYARQADRYLHDNPWPIVAGGIVLGALATLWFRQRR